MLVQLPHEVVLVGIGIDSINRCDHVIVFVTVVRRRVKRGSTPQSTQSIICFSSDMVTTAVTYESLCTPFLDV